MNFQTRVKSLVMALLTSDLRRGASHRLSAMGRRLRGQVPTVHYFHEVGDPYSHLAVQKLDQLKTRYPVEFAVHLTSGEADAYRGDPSRYYSWAIGDAANVASFYGVQFPSSPQQPTDNQIVTVTLLLESVSGTDEFAAVATRVGNELWQGEIKESGDTSAIANFNDLVRPGNQLRAKLGHYAGAMFYFDGEWYWGLDRLYHLEARLQAMGLGASGVLVPRPAPESATGLKASNVELSYFPSLRSPYTAISFARTMDVVDRSGVNLHIKPVMPMMMRGVPAPGSKQMYIITDAKREADAYGVPFGKIVDPFGEPVKRAFSLLPFVRSHGQLRAYVGRYLEAAWAEGIDITVDRGLQRVIEDIGLSWQEARPHLGDSAYEAELEANVNEMLAASIWGVPSYCVSGGNRTEPFWCWGQDRLWRVETEIARRAR